MSTVPAITTAQPTTWTVPGPRPDRVFGRTGNILRMFADPIGYCDRLFREHGRIAARTAGGGTNVYSPLPACAGTVFAFGPDVVHDVTSQHDVFAKHPLTGTFYRRATARGRTAALRHYTVGLFGVNGDEHRRHRRLLMPAFHRKRVESCRDTTIALTDEALGALRPGESVDMADVMRVLTLRIATTTLFGQDVGPQGERLGHIAAVPFSAGAACAHRPRGSDHARPAARAAGRSAPSGPAVRRGRWRRPWERTGDGASAGLIVATVPPVRYFCSDGRTPATPPGSGR
jgi:cytochrome P450